MYLPPPATFFALLQDILDFMVKKRWQIRNLSSATHLPPFKALGYVRFYKPPAVEGCFLLTPIRK